MSQAPPAKSTKTPGLIRVAVAAFALGSLLSSCSDSEDTRFPPYDNTGEVEAFWESKPEFFQWKTAADLPANLTWEDCADVPEFGDPRAKKGGTFHDWHPTFPPTFLKIGPDANNTFRG